MTGAQSDTFLLKPGRGRVFIQTFGLVLPACAFAALAVVILTIFKVESGLARAALLVLAVGLIALAAFFLLFLSVNWICIEVGPDKLKLRLPRLRGPIPLPSLIRAEIPYSEIAAVEHREEMYSSFGLVSVQDAYSLVLRDSARVPLGALTEHWTTPLPVYQAAERIAKRAGCSIRDRGAVRVGGIVRGIIRDTPPWGTETMTAAERKLWHAHAVRTLRILAILFALVAVARACAR